VSMAAAFIIIVGTILGITGIISFSTQLIISISTLVAVYLIAIIDIVKSYKNLTKHKNLLKVVLFFDKK